MGNSLTGSEPQDVPQRPRSADVGAEYNESRPKPIAKSRVRLVPLSGSPSTSLDSNPSRSIPEVHSTAPTHYSRSNQQHAYDGLSEEEQVRIAHRIGLIQHLPINIWKKSKQGDIKVRECCICMVDFEDEESVRYLPCMHYYHVDCIDDWLQRSFICPTCMEPVDAALLSSYEDRNKPGSASGS